MKKMPHELKKKLRRYNKLVLNSKLMYIELERMFEDYGVPYENLTATQESGNHKYEPSTEALAYISNCEGDLEDNIADIEQVFLHFVNKDK